MGGQNSLRTDPNRNSNGKYRSTAICRIPQRMRSPHLRNRACIPMPKILSNMGTIKKVLHKWGERNRASPWLIVAVLYGISSWCRCQIPTPPSTFTTSSSQILPKKKRFAPILNGSNGAQLRAKTTGKRWISSIIQKFWDTSWYVWNYRNNTSHSQYGPTKTDILIVINNIITHHLNRGKSGLSHRCHFLLHTYIHTLL